MIVKFGESYKDYIRRTKMFIPLVFLTDCHNPERIGSLNEEDLQTINFA